ncbi:hypothetical protein DNTS_003746, partial [Danionella cerebrum]
MVKYERIKFLVLALKSSMEVYAWAHKPYHKFMAFKVWVGVGLGYGKQNPAIVHPRFVYLRSMSLTKSTLTKSLTINAESFGDLVHKPLLVDLTVEKGQRLKVIYGSCSGFHAVDVDSGAVYDIYLPTHIKSELCRRWGRRFGRLRVGGGDDGSEDSVSAVGTTDRKTPCRRWGRRFGRLRVGMSAGICWVYGNNWEEIWIETQNKPNFLEHLPSLLLNFNGRGVFAAQPIEPGAFVLEYRGKLISAEECQSRLYTERESTLLLDASKEDGSLGRLVNDNDKSPNCTMKKIIVKDKPHLCLFAVKRIEPGTEIDYNYGDVKWPWRKKVGTEEFPAARVESSTALIEEISRDQDGSIQVGTEECPAARVESSTALIEEISRDQDGSIQVGTEEFPAARVESSTALIEEISRDQDGSIQ